MKFVSSCKCETSFNLLNNALGQKTLAIPDEKYKVLSILEGYKGEDTWKGALEQFILGKMPRAFEQENIENSPVPTTTKTGKFDTETGLILLEHFLEGFGISNKRFLSRFKKASEMSFRFRNIERKFIDIDLLKSLLTGRNLDISRPELESFLKNGTVEFRVVDSIIASNEFSVIVTYGKNVDLNLDVDSLLKILGNKKADIEIKSTADNELAFKGKRNVTFAYSSVQFNLDRKSGNIFSASPQSMLRSYCTNKLWSSRMISALLLYNQNHTLGK